MSQVCADIHNSAVSLKFQNPLLVQQLDHNRGSEATTYIMNGFMQKKDGYIHNVIYNIDASFFISTLAISLLHLQWGEYFLLRASETSCNNKSYY